MGFFVTLLTIIASGLGYVVKEQWDKIKTIQNQLSEKKYKVYYEIYSIVFDIFKEQKKLTGTPSNDLVSRLIDVKKDLLIYAPDEIVKKFLEWNIYVNNKQNDSRQFKLYIELFVLIRKDMGQTKTKISEQDIVRMIAPKDDDYEEIKKILFSQTES